ncbi:MAG: hypothetical protein ABW022_14865 [Actinoplanes sp.]
MTTVNEAADIIRGDYGQLTITYRRLVYTWTVTVYCGGILRVEELCATFDNAHAAWTEARRIALAAHQGKTVRQIEAEKPSELALAEAKRIIDGVSANLDTVQKQVDTAIADTATKAQAATADPAESWAAYRQSLTPRVPTASRVHTKPLTAAELDLIRNHRNGVVTTRPGQSWLMLRAIWRRIGGQPTYRPGTRIIASLRLNRAGLELAGQPVGRVAA